MASKTKNSYVPNYVSENFPWYEPDGLMAWYDQGKRANFLRHASKNFHEAKIINFDIIHRQCWDEVILPHLLKYYQTINGNIVSWGFSSKQTEMRSSAFRTDRKDMYFEKKKTIEKHFTKKKKIKSSFFRSKLFCVFNILF